MTSDIEDVPDGAAQLAPKRAVQDQVPFERKGAVDAQASLMVTGFTMSDGP